MRALHISDTHHKEYWETIDLGTEVDAVIHTGDMLPDFNKDTMLSQQAWFVARKKKFLSWLDGRDFIYIQGNHDFFDVGSLLPNSIKATDKPTTINGFKVAGFSNIPFINGRWNNETNKYELIKVIDSMFSLDADIMLSHCPPYQILDDDTSASPYRLPGKNFGVTSYATQALYRPHNFKHFLFGHIHRATADKLTLEISDRRLNFYNSAVCPYSSVEWNPGQLIDFKEV